MEELSQARLTDTLAHFVFPEAKEDIRRYGSGHINDTYLVCAEDRRAILQRINRTVFAHPDEVMENIQRVTNYLGNIIVKRGGDPLRETLTLIPTRMGAPYWQDSEGDYWRMYVFVEDTMSYDLPESPEIFRRAAVSFGRFQRDLSGFDASVLHETIPHFHDTPDRYRQLTEAIRADKLGRVKDVAAELAFVEERRGDLDGLAKLLKEGKLPLRVTHNDTKLNNILMDATTHDGLCVIDLDTVMPGLAAYDFGDSIRFGGNTAAEDETDLDKVKLDLEMYRAYVEGYLDEAGDALTPLEKSTLPLGAKLMTMECGMRFLTDYLNGDVYFRIHRPLHNLERARDQFALVADMERKWDEMAKLTAEA